MKYQDIAKHVFARHPKLDAVHITSDGQAFTELHQADAHAQRQHDKKVKTLHRDESVKVADHVAHNGVDLDAEATAKAEIQARYDHARDLDIDVDGIDDVAIVNELIKERQNQELEVVGDSPSAPEGKTTKADPEKVEEVLEEAASPSAPEGGTDSAQDADKFENATIATLLAKNVSGAKADIEKVKTSEELDEIQAAEKEGDDRKGVNEAIEARRKALTDKNQDND